MKKKKNQDTIKKEVYKCKWEHVFNKNWTLDEINYIADEMLEWFERKIMNPVTGVESFNLWLRDFAIEKRFTRTKIYEFIEKSEYFAKMHEVCNSIQESRLFKIGLSSKSAMPIFALKNVAGWGDKTEITFKGLEELKEDLNKAMGI